MLQVKCAAWRDVVGRRNTRGSDQQQSDERKYSSFQWVLPMRQSQISGAPAASGERIPERCKQPVRLYRSGVSVESDWLAKDRRRFFNWVCFVKFSVSGQNHTGGIRGVPTKSSIA
jgi:hypothetical protein